MPSREVRQYIGNKWPSFEVVESIAEHFDVSLTATARKYCDVASQSCAVVWSQEGIIRWFHPSQTFPYWIKVGRAVGSDSWTAKAFEGKQLPAFMEDVPAEDWTSSSWLRTEAQLKEQSIPMPSYRGCLSLLWVNRVIEDRPSAEDELLQELDPDRFNSLNRKNWPGKR